MKNNNKSNINNIENKIIEINNQINKELINLVNTLKDLDKNSTNILLDLMVKNNITKKFFLNKKLNNNIEFNDSPIFRNKNDLIFNAFENKNILNIKKINLQNTDLYSLKNRDSSIELNENSKIDDKNLINSLNLYLHIYKYALNKKKVFWTFKIDKISDMIYLGLIEEKASIIDEKNIFVEEYKKIISKDELFKNNFYLLTSDLKIIFSSNGNKNMNSYSKNKFFNEGDTVKFNFNNIKKTLKIKIKKINIVIENINYDNNKILVPCFILLNKNDVITFSDFNEII